MPQAVSAADFMEDLRFALESANYGTFRYDVRKNEREWDDRFRSCFGFPADAPASDDALYDAMHPDDRETIRAAFQRCLASPDEPSFEAELRLFKDDDSGARYARLRGRAYFDGPNAVRFVGISEDITAHRRMLGRCDRAELERDRLRALFDGSPALIAILIGPEHVIEVANDGFHAAFAHARPVLGKPLREALAELEDQGIVDLVAQVFRTGEPHRALEAPLLLRGTAGLEQRFFDIVYAPVRGAGATIVGVSIFAHEVTLSVRARNAMQEAITLEEAARKQLEDASRTKDEFLSTLSHELRTPMNAILGWATMLRNESLSPEQQARALETVERNARMQTRLIEDLLDLSRMVQGKFVLSVGPVEMVRVVEAALETVRPAAEAKGIRLQPVLDSHATIVGDPDRLQQIVWNLLANAIKFTPKGGRVQVRLRRDTSYVEVAIADNGQGIDPAFLPHVFDRFRQADGGITRRTGGLGLGLAIVRSLVELHGGTVEARSDGVGHGATFVVRLPMAPLRADKEPVTPTRAGMPVRTDFDCPPELKGARVLVVDDEADTRQLLEYLLVQCEAVVKTAASAEEAMAALRAERFDVLVSDVGMPDEDGYQLLQRVRALPPEQNGRIPALALTAYARGVDRTRALRHGFSMHLAKPIEPSELLVVVAHLASTFPALLDTDLDRLAHVVAADRVARLVEVDDVARLGGELHDVAAVARDDAGRRRLRRRVDRDDPLPRLGAARPALERHLAVRVDGRDVGRARRRQRQRRIEARDEREREPGGEETATNRRGQRR